MNDDYLWDRTGEPDPEIQQLEEVLGTLRYQPRALRTAGASADWSAPRLLFRVSQLLRLSRRFWSGESSWLMLRKQTAPAEPQSQPRMLPLPKEVADSPQKRPRRLQRIQCSSPGSVS